MSSALAPFPAGTLSDAGLETNSQEIPLALEARLLKSSSVSVFFDLLSG